MSEPRGTSSGGAVTQPPGLRRDAIGLREVLFQSITDMAPGAAIAASIPAGAAYAGGALPLGRAVRADGLSAVGVQRRRAGPGTARGGLGGHLRRPRPAPGHRVPGRLGPRAGSGAEP